MIGSFTRTSHVNVFDSLTTKRSFQRVAIASFIFHFFADHVHTREGNVLSRLCLSVHERGAGWWGTLYPGPERKDPSPPLQSQNLCPLPPTFARGLWDSGLSLAPDSKNRDTKGGGGGGGGLVVNMPTNVNTRYPRSGAQDGPTVRNPESKYLLKTKFSNL